MSFDYRKEFAIFKSEWEKQEAIMREEGMSEETITELYDFSYEQFKADRNYALHKFDFAQTDDEENLPDVKTKKQGMVTQPSEFEQCFNLLEQIESPKLLKALKQLKPSDYDLLCMVAVDGLSGKEIALKTGQTPSSVSQKLTRIKNFLKKFL